jgi:hypothetical protein
MKRKRFKIAAVYDTETCNVGKGNQTRAYPILFIDNDIRGIDLKRYIVDESDHINMYRYETEYINQLHTYINYGKNEDVVPIVCAYNLMFDLQPLMYRLSQEFDIEANAQSSTNVYTLDLFEKESGAHLLRFWDTFHLEMRGLKAMGEMCGIEKLSGDWDYSKVRTPETTLTDMELYYARRDVQVIPAYLRYLLQANEWLSQSDLGNKVITKTSIVRQMARKTIGNITIDKINGKKLTMFRAFNNMCKRQLPSTFNVYCLRKACFRGGFTFTSAKYACELMHNVASLDVTSMHHTFINGRYIPVDFTVPSDMSILENTFKENISTTRDAIEKNYAKPFDKAFHMEIRFTNVRLREGSVFEEQGIALESTAKFKKQIVAGTEIGNDPRNAAQENEARKNGWHDMFFNGTFAFGKLYAADEVTMHLNELELWCFSRVYQWDKHEILCGEITASWKLPPDYVTLQSNILFETKNDAKFIHNHYREGEPYPYRMPATIPTGIAKSLLDGTCSEQFFESYYTNTVKGMFNGIYGTMAQDIYKPDYASEEGELFIDRDTITTAANWNDHQPRQCKVLYTYGMRIVGGSRMHLILAMEHLHEYFGERARITGGDTDSMKVSFDEDVTDAEIMEALEPIKKCSKAAIDACMKRVREDYPQHASPLTGIGSFDIEKCGGNEKRWQNHMEYWNKARISESHGHSHITCAGLSRPEGQYHIENFIDDMIAAGNDTEKVFKNAMGYNVCVANPICHALEGRKPRATDVFDKDITDYMGNTYHVHSHESQALYEADRMLGETSKIANSESLEYLLSKYGRRVNEDTRYLELSGNKASVMVLDNMGKYPIMECEVHA